MRLQRLPSLGDNPNDIETEMEHNGQDQRSVSSQTGRQRCDVTHRDLYGSLWLCSTAPVKTARI